MNGRLEETRQAVARLSSPGRVDVAQLLGHQRYELVLQSQLRELNEQLRRLHVEVEKRRRALVLADQQVRVLDKLRTKRKERHDYAESRRTQNELDEFAQRNVIGEES